MSGGTWDYRNTQLKSVLMDVSMTTRPHHQKLAKIISHLGTILDDLTFKLDFHYAGDTEEDLEKVYQRLIKQIQRLPGVSK